MKKKRPLTGCLSLHRGYMHVYRHYFENFFSETAWPIIAKFHVKPLSDATGLLNRQLREHANNKRTMGCQTEKLLLFHTLKELKGH